MHHIRPHRLFNIVNTDRHISRMAQIALPDQDTPALLDTAILLSLARLVQPRNVFEFGTFLGVQTLNMAANIKSAEMIYTLDLDEASSGSVSQQKEDAVLTVKHLAQQKQMAFVDTPYAAKVRQLLGDSNTFDFSPFHGKMDMVYIDGGHDLPTLVSDTKNSFAMLASGRPTCIAWHDYNNATYPQVGTYLDELSADKEIFHIEASWLCFHLQNPLADVEDRLAGK